MSLLEYADSIPGSVQSQAFGVPSTSIYTQEPAMYETGTKAYWHYYPLARFHSHFHPGVDRAAAEGTPIKALEDGTVTWANLGSPTNPSGSIDGIRVEAEIRPGTRYGFNHLSALAVKKGDKVRRGQVIGYVGSTGASTGPHAHEYLSHVEIGIDGIPRTFLYDPSLFRPGAMLANAAWIRPVAPPVIEDPMPTRFAIFDPPCQVVIRAGVNVRTGPGFDYPVIVLTEGPSSPIWLVGWTVGDEYDVGSGSMNTWYIYWMANKRTADPLDGRFAYFAKPLCRITKRG